MIKEIIYYFQTSSSEYWQAVGQHLCLSFTSLTIAFVIAFPLGYWGSKSKMIASFCTAFAQLLRIVPSLALLFILIPFIGTGMIPAIIALVILALPPLIINIILGFNEVPKDDRDVGLALGMSNFQLLKWVLLPWAWPYILNGVKLALVEVISSASLAAYIGAGGLGDLIMEGLGLYKMQYVIIGGVSVALLSVISIFCFDLIIRRITNNG